MKAAALLLALAASTHATVLTPENYDDLTQDKSVTRGVRGAHACIFVARAPAEIVATERQKLEQAKSALNTLQRQRNQIEELRSD